jgi:thiol-disulfide isomerase/thioredoxin
MSKKYIQIALIATAAVAVVAGVSLILHHKRGAAGIRSVSAAPSPAAPATDSNSTVIRFVKNPETAPPFQAKDIQGRAVTKASWSGKVVLVNFWATWCPPCREEIPELFALKKQYGDRLEIIGISEDDDSPEKVLKFAQQKGMTYPIVMYTPELVASYGGVPALPTSFLIDTQGRVVQKHSGLYPIESYQQEIRALLGLPTDGRVETFVDTGQVFLKNAVNATDLPGVDFKGLTADQKKMALHRMNAESCTCGCTLTLSQCRVNDSECPVSKDITAGVVKEVARSEKMPSTSKGVSSTAK